MRGRGEFAVRGGLVDVYPALGDPLRVEFWGDEIDTVRTFSVYSQRTTGTLDEATVWAAFEADTGLTEYQTGLHQAIAAWEREGREEAPDELYRRAGVRALAALAGRFTTAADLVDDDGRRVAVFNPDETYRALADFAGEVEMTVDGAGLRERLYVPLADARALLPARCTWTWCSATSPCSSPPLARSSRRATWPAPSATCRASSATTTACSSCSATRARRNAPPTACATSRRRSSRPNSSRAAARPVPASTSSPPRCARASSPRTSSSPWSVSALAARRAARATLRRRHPSHHVLRRAPRRLRGPRGPRHRQVRRHRDAHRRGRHARLPAAAVPRRGPRVRAARPDRQGQPLCGRRRRGAGAGQARRHPLAAVKTRARRPCVEMAEELLQLYAARQAVPGFAFPAGRRAHAQFEADFPFEETAGPGRGHRGGQGRHGGAAAHGPAGAAATWATARPRWRCAPPSRRSLAGKQVAVLVPTTVLAQQHYHDLRASASPTAR